MINVTHINESYHTRKWVVSHANESCLTHKYVMSHTHVCACMSRSIAWCELVLCLYVLCVRACAWEYVLWEYVLCVCISENMFYENMFSVCVHVIEHVLRRVCMCLRTCSIRTCPLCVCVCVNRFYENMFAVCTCLRHMHTHREHVLCVYGLSVHARSHADSHTLCRRDKCHVTHTNESCHTYKWVMSHIQMSHVTHTNESCHTYKW